MNDLVQNLEHGLGDDLQHLWNGTETDIINIHVTMTIGSTHLADISDKFSRVVGGD